MRIATPFVILLAAVLGACSSSEPETPVAFAAPETFVDYDVELTGVSDDDVRGLMEQALALYRQQEKGAQSLAFLRRRAQGDVATAQKILRSFGWYEAEVAVAVDSVESEPAQDGAAEGGAAEGAANAPPRAVARLSVTENRRYDLGAHDFTLTEPGEGPPPTSPDAAALGSPLGAPAVAANILAAERGAVAALRADGRPYARLDGRDAVADPETAEIELTTTIVAGGAYVFGGAVYDGAEGVKREYLDTYRTWEEGARVDPAILKAFQNELVSTGLFDGASADFPDEPPAGDVAPIIVKLEEAKPRTISGGVRYDTSAGPAVRGGFEHRNLFGANETLTLEALAGIEEQSLGADYRIPQHQRNGQDLIFGAEVRRIDDEAFEEIGGTLAVGIERELSDHVTIGLGGLLEISRIEDIDGRETSKLVGLPAFIAYDDSDDRLDPSKGVRARVSFTPFTGLQGDDYVGFGVADATASTYFDLTGEKTYILAVRGRLASVIAGDLDTVAANRRLYSGGGGSVRGYSERFIGPLDADDEPTGGLSAVEAGVEMRARFANDIGGALFIEGASVSEEVAPVFDEGFRVAVGAGVRYFSPVGPIRLDVGFPINGREVDDTFQFYISIGQAF